MDFHVNFTYFYKTRFRSFIKKFQLGTGSTCFKSAFLENQKYEMIAKMKILFIVFYGKYKNIA